MQSCVWPFLRYWFFSSIHLIKLGDFLPTTFYQTIILIFQFFFLNYLTRVEIFCINWFTGFFLFSPIRLGSFLFSNKQFQIALSIIYIFGKLYAKEKYNYNAKVTRFKVTWPINLIIYHAKILYTSNSAFFSLGSIWHYYNPFFAPYINLDIIF